MGSFLYLLNCLGVNQLVKFMDILLIGLPWQKIITSQSFAMMMLVILVQYHSFRAFLKKILLLLFQPHLGPFAKKEARKAFSAATKQMGNLDYYVDRMHFRGHKGDVINNIFCLLIQHLCQFISGKYCHDNFNPYSCDKLQLVNTVICEQTFRWINQFRQVHNQSK